MFITQIIIQNHYTTQLSKQLSRREIIISRCIMSYSMKCSIFIALVALASCDWSSESYVVLSIALLVQIPTNSDFRWCKYHIWAHTSHSYSAEENIWIHQSSQNTAPLHMTQLVLSLEVTFASSRKQTRPSSVKDSDEESESFPWSGISHQMSSKTI